MFDTNIKTAFKKINRQHKICSEYLSVMFVQELHSWLGGLAIFDIQFFRGCASSRYKAAMILFAGQHCDGAISSSLARMRDANNRC